MALLTFSQFLQEITRPEDIDAAADVLRQGGWTRTGKGAFASVFSNPKKDYVLKLFGNDDTAYQRYLELITSKSNPHFPVIRGKPMRVNNTYSAVRMEKLQSRPTDLVNTQTFPRSGDYLDQLRDLHNWEKEKVGNRDWPTSPYNQGIHQLRNQLNSFAKDHPNIASAMDLIHKDVILPTGARPDIHDGNFMWRGNTMVIIDPVWEAHRFGDRIPPDPKQLNLFRKLPLATKQSSGSDDYKALFGGSRAAPPVKSGMTPCRHSWQKAMDGSRCGDRASKKAWMRVFKNSDRRAQRLPFSRDRQIRGWPMVIGRRGPSPRGGSPDF